MSFLDKIKNGVSEAGNKAKVTLEVNRLKMQLSSLQKDIEAKYKLIGEAVYRSFSSQSSTGDTEKHVRLLCQEISKSNEEITEFTFKINEYLNVKTCVCGKELPLDHKFCSNCGYRFEVEKQQPAEQHEALKQPMPNEVQNCKSCGGDMQPGDSFCGNCGDSA